MRWNWQQEDWPNFRWKTKLLEELEAQFLHKSGVLIGTTKLFSKENKTVLIVDIMTGEAVKTSEIEGEYMDRNSVQSSIRRNLGLDLDNKRIAPACLYPLS